MADFDDAISAAPKNIAELLPSPYLSAMNLPPHPVVCTIRDVLEVRLADRPGIKNKGAKARKTLVFLAEYEKGVLCGAKCMRALITRFGNELDASKWIGQRVTVRIEIDKNPQAPGKMGPCIRFDHVPPPDVPTQRPDPLITALGRVGVTPEMVQAWLGHLPPTPDEVAALKRIGTAIKGGSTWEAETAPVAHDAATGELSPDREPGDDDEEVQ